MVNGAGASESLDLQEWISCRRYTGCTDPSIPLRLVIQPIRATSFTPPFELIGIRSDLSDTQMGRIQQHSVRGKV